MSIDRNSNVRVASIAKVRESSPQTEEALEHVAEDQIEKENEFLKEAEGNEEE